MSSGLTVNISSRYLDTLLPGYFSIPNVLRFGYAEGRGPTGEDIGTYRGLREFILVFPTVDAIPKSGSDLDLYNYTNRVVDAAKEGLGDPGDLILVFPLAAVYLLSDESDRNYRNVHSEVVKGHEAVHVE